MKNFMRFGFIAVFTALFISCGGGTDMKKIEAEARMSMKNMVGSMNEIAAKMNDSQSAEDTIMLIKKSGELFLNFTRELKEISDKYNLNAAQDDELQGRLSDVYAELGAASETLNKAFGTAAEKFADSADVMEQLKTTIDVIVEASRM
jgi:ABC-type transporter Mla subunit MlaD